MKNWKLHKYFLCIEYLYTDRRSHFFAFIGNKINDSKANITENILIKFLEVR